MDAAYDVFLSYARADGARARVIRDQLSQLGLKVFFDTEGIDTGEEFPVIIDRAVKGAKCVLGLWSRQAFARRWVRIESRIGLDQKKLVAALIDGMRHDELPAEFYNVNVENLADYRGQAGHEGWARVLRAIGKRTGRPDLARAAAPAQTQQSAPQPSMQMPSFAPVMAAAREINPLYMVGAGVALIVGVGVIQTLNKPAGLDAASSRFSGSEVFTPGAAEAATQAPAADLTGAWAGYYAQNGVQVPFEMEVRSDMANGASQARGFVGQSGEPNSFALTSTAQYLYAEISGEARADGAISFSKTYNGAGGVTHSVTYEGRVENGGQTIIGTWSLPGGGGDFRMDRR